MNRHSAAAALLDLLLPGAGQVAQGRIRAGWNALAAFLGIESLLALSVAWMGLDPRRAMVTLGIAWLTFQGLLRLEGQSPAAAPFSVRRGLAAWAAGLVLIGLVAAVISLRALPVPIRDHALWPAFLPGEWVLVYRVGPDKVPSLKSRLVAARTPAGLVASRLVAVGPARVQWTGPGLLVEGEAVPLSDLGDVVLEDPWTVPEEQRGLRAWMEGIESERHPVFFSRLVATSPREFLLPEGTMLLLADNRSTLDALDGRTFGPLPIGDVVGVVGPVIWSPGPWGLPRWQRLGMQWP